MSELIREGYSGTGPGAITPDGCAVELYARLKAGAEPEVIAGAVPPGARLLELGCGAGRLTRPLTERGFTVTAVDESAEMLAHVEGLPGVARAVRSPIEALAGGALGERCERFERFDVVLLASFLVHAADPEVRDGILRACRTHVADDGCVLIQREGADYHTDLPRERVDPAGYTVRIVSSTPVGGGVNSVHAQYIWPDATWTQTFRARVLSTAEFEEHLARAGLAVDRVLTDDGTWVRARPVTA
ncbi:methyltransferase domain-containing protein [Streptomyces sp. LHD-70]|uniref:class I SAM-dependent methyltransferase n=1 Tax=Streptomyces sp. LHD-70 TaxID=3072140 RepID=UPI00280C5243|nr:methyltransferase domain-containing protein [Streptomyces sp. LHD-70]MDQ8701624.1 methyltransferase domain-containing protein [Streptomyces sp. LHD-70]